jgi:hypothetical protein
VEIRSRLCPEVSINSPSGEGGESKGWHVEQVNQLKFPLILLQAKAVSWNFVNIRKLCRVVSINSPSGEGGESSNFGRNNSFVNELFPLILLQAKAVR